MSSANPDGKRGYWKSLLNVLMEADVEEQDVVLVEAAPGDIWEFAFWSQGPDGFPNTYCCKVGRNIWTPVETPGYTGAVQPYTRDRTGRQPYHGDPNPK